MITLTWLCPECDAKHVDDHEPLTCCACGAEWNPLLASRDEVDRYLDGLGWDAEDLRRTGERLAARVMAHMEARRLADEARAGGRS